MNQGKSVWCATRHSRNCLSCIRLSWHSIVCDRAPYMFHSSARISNGAGKGGLPGLLIKITRARSEVPISIDLAQHALLKVVKG
jgi:hypothetical protein